MTTSELLCSNCGTKVGDLVVAAAPEPESSLSEHALAIAVDVERWLRTATVLSEAATVSAADLYQAYLAWARRTIHPQAHISPNMFGRTLKHLGVRSGTVKGQRHYLGLALTAH